LGRLVDISPRVKAEAPQMRSVAAVGSIEKLRQHVLVTLCSHDHLDPAQTPLQQAVIIRRGKPCGMMFQVQGPRSLRSHAVWAGEEHRILFYDSNGERFAECRLSDSPDPRKLAA
jgi:hypothetical protein